MDRSRRRRFGQNFLHDPAFAQLLAADLPISTPGPILEIGPGHGALTKPLLARCNHLTAVEIDPLCAHNLRSSITSPILNIVCENFLEFPLLDWAVEHPEAWIAGNLPYNMATPILLHLLPHLHKFKGIMAMVQYEVAMRICATPGNSDYGTLTVMVQAYAKSRILRKVPREQFNPKPNVLSATFLLEPLENPYKLPPGFREFLFVCFRQKRKTLYNCLRSVLPQQIVMETLHSCGITLQQRAEELPLPKFLELHALLALFLPPINATEVA